jgi:hypothetical protein
MAESCEFVKSWLLRAKREVRKGQDARKVRKRHRTQPEQNEEVQSAQKMDEEGKASWTTEEKEEGGTWAQLAKLDDADSSAGTVTEAETAIPPSEAGTAVITPLGRSATSPPLWSDVWGEREEVRPGDVINGHKVGFSCSRVQRGGEHFRVVEAEFDRSKHSDTYVLHDVYQLHNDVQETMHSVSTC